MISGNSIKCLPDPSGKYIYMRIINLAQKHYSKYNLNNYLLNVYYLIVGHTETHFQFSACHVQP